jgi:S-adenosyl-L-methionine hydrolase (adenosine-forming)
MPVITLTTDLGLDDYYLALVKAKILSQLPDAQIIDISHSINPFDIAEAAFVLKTILKEFPKDTIHIVAVGTEAVDDIRHIGIRYKDRYILTADTGLFSLIADQHADLIVELQMNIESDVLIFPARDLYAPAAVFLANGGTLEVIGRRTDKLVERISVKPTTGHDYIKGAVIYVDKYGNAISNIDNTLIKEIGKGREFHIGFVQKGYEMTEIKKRYSDVPLGDRLALMNSAGHLEIAINQGHAANLLGLHTGATVIMTF